MSVGGITNCYVPGCSRDASHHVSVIWDEDGHLLDIGDSTSPGLVDGRGATMIPALVDPHFHGLGGHSVLRRDGLEEVRGVLWREGVHAFCASSVGMSAGDLFAWLSSVAGVCDSTAASSEAMCLGAHIEGPFISADFAGAHNPQYTMGADIALLRELLEQPASRSIRTLTLSPGAVADGFVETASQAGIHVALGHTGASRDSLEAAIHAGADCVTHMFNAMPPVSAREPGLLGLAMEYGLYAEVIPNPEMLDPLNLRLVVRALGTDRLIATSDALSRHTFPTVTLSPERLTFRCGKRIMGGAASLARLLPFLRGPLSGSVGDLIKVTSQNALRYFGRTPTWPFVVGEPVRAMLIDHAWKATSLCPPASTEIRRGA